MEFAASAGSRQSPFGRKTRAESPKVAVKTDVKRREDATSAAVLDGKPAKCNGRSEKKSRTNQTRCDGMCKSTGGETVERRR